MRLFRAAFLPLIAAVALVATACVPPPDGGGGSTTNLSPFAVATADPTTGQAPLLVQFSPAGSTDPDGFIESYSWNFGDGSPLSTVPNPVHTYAAGGTFNDKLTVTDDDFQTTTGAVYSYRSGDSEVAADALAQG